VRSGDIAEILISIFRFHNFMGVPFKSPHAVFINLFYSVKIEVFSTTAQGQLFEYGVNYPIHKEE
jgi:hypothetical protein